MSSNDKCFSTLCIFVAEGKNGSTLKECVSMLLIARSELPSTNIGRNFITYTDESLLWKAIIDNCSQLAETVLVLQDTKDPG